MKGNCGHLTMGIGAFETAMTIKSMVTGDIPYIKNCEDPCDQQLNLILKKNIKLNNIDTVLKMGAGLGVNTCALVFKTYKE